MSSISTGSTGPDQPQKVDPNVQAGQVQQQVPATLISEGALVALANQDPKAVEDSINSMLNRVGFQRSAEGGLVVKDAGTVDKAGRVDGLTSAEKVYASGGTEKLGPPAPPKVEINAENKLGAESFAVNLDKLVNEILLKDPATLTSAAERLSADGTLNTAATGAGDVSALNTDQLHKLSELSADILMALFLKLNINDPNNSVETHNKLHELSTQLRQQAIDDAQKKAANAKEAMAEAEKYAAMAQMIGTIVQVVMIVVTILLTIVTFGAAAPLALAVMAAVAAIAGAISAASGGDFMQGAMLGFSLASMGVGLAAAAAQTAASAAAQAATRAATEVASKATAEITKATVEQMTKAATQAAVKAAQQSGKQISQKALKQAIQKAVQKAIESSGKQVAQDLTTNVMQSTIEQTMETTIQESVTQGTQTALQASAESGEKVAIEMSEEGLQNMTQEATKAVTEEMAHQGAIETMKFTQGAVGAGGQVVNAAAQRTATDMALEAQQKDIAAKRQRQMAEMMQQQIEDEGAIMNVIMESKNQVVDAVLRMMNTMFTTNQKMMSVGLTSR